MSFTDKGPGKDCLTNLLTNSQWMAMSGSTLENVGSQLVTGWTNGAAGYNTFSATGANITSAINNDSGTDGADSNQMTGEIGKLYKVVATLTLNSGAAPSIDMLTATGGGGSRVWDNIGPTLSAGANTFVFELKTSTTFYAFMKNVADTNYSCTFTLYEVTPGYVAADTLAPDGWTKYDTTCDLYRQHNDATYTKSGSFYSLKMVAGADGDTIYQSFTNKISSMIGRTLTFGAWVYTDTANRAILRLSDSVGNNASSYHTGVAGWEWLEVTRTIPTNATSLLVLLYSLNGTSTIYFSQPMLVMGSSIGSGNYQPAPNEELMYATPFVLTGYSAAVPADATINLEAASSGKIGKGIKRLFGYHYGQNTAANKYLLLGSASGTTHSRLISQVANVPISLSYDVKCDSNGDMYIDVEDANWSAYNIYVTGIGM